MLNKMRLPLPSPAILARAAERERQLRKLTATLGQQSPPAWMAAKPVPWLESCYRLISAGLAEIQGDELKICESRSGRDVLQHAGDMLTCFHQDKSIGGGE